MQTSVQLSNHDLQSLTKLSAPYKLFLHMHKFHKNSDLSVILFLRPHMNFYVYIWYSLTNVVKFGTEGPNMMLPRNCEFRENQCSKSQTSLRGINKFLSILPTFTVYWTKFCIWDLNRSQWPRGLRCGYAAAHLLGFYVRILWGHGCLSLVSVVCCQVEVSATGWSLIQRSPTECGVSKVWSWSLEQWGGLGPLGAVKPLNKKKNRYEHYAVQVNKGHNFLKGVN
jgi:hypothetical protein